MVTGQIGESASACLPASNRAAFSMTGRTTAEDTVHDAAVRFCSWIPTARTANVPLQRSGRLPTLST